MSASNADRGLPLAAFLGVGDFLGEGCLAGRALYLGTSVCCRRDDQRFHTRAAAPRVRGHSGRLGEIRSGLVDLRSLQGFPSALGAVVGQIGGDRVGVELRIEFTASVVVKHRQDQVASPAVFVGSVLSHASLGASFQLLQRFVHGPAVCLGQPIVLSRASHDRN